MYNITHNGMHRTCSLPCMTSHTCGDQPFLLPGSTTVTSYVDIPFLCWGSRGRTVLIVPIFSLVPPAPVYEYSPCPSCDTFEGSTAAQTASKLPWTLEADAAACSPIVFSEGILIVDETCRHLHVRENCLRNITIECGTATED